MFSFKLSPAVCAVGRCINVSRGGGNVGVNAASLHTTSINRSDIKLEKTINQVTLLGRAGNDPQKKGTADHPVVVFSLATHNNYKYDSGDMIQRTDWHRVSVFRPGLRDTVEQYLKKGSRVYVTGRLTYGEIQTDDGGVRTMASIIADDVIFLHSKNYEIPEADVL